MGYRESGRESWGDVKLVKRRKKREGKTTREETGRE